MTSQGLPLGEELVGVASRELTHAHTFFFFLPSLLEKEEEVYTNSVCTHFLMIPFSKRFLKNAQIKSFSEETNVTLQNKILSTIVFVCVCGRAGFLVGNYLFKRIFFFSSLLPFSVVVVVVVFTGNETSEQREMKHLPERIGRVVVVLPRSVKRSGQNSAN